MATTSDIAIKREAEHRKKQRLEARLAYAKLRNALCDIEGGVADTFQKARDIAARAIFDTPPSIKS